jgi:ketosteroid isomerase-like protein
MTADEMRAFAARLMRSLQDGDFDTTVDCFQPDATWWMNGRLRGKFEELLPEMKAAKLARGVNAHLEIRRMCSEEGFTDQHVVRLPREDRAPAELAICVVARVDAEGRITRFEEYFDSAALTD